VFNNKVIVNEYRKPKQAFRMRRDIDRNFGILAKEEHA
jgi:hypothetical protein